VTGYVEVSVEGLLHEDLTKLGPALRQVGALAVDAVQVQLNASVVDYGGSLALGGGMRSPRRFLISEAPRQPCIPSRAGRGTVPLFPERQALGA
jgi:hypothetical protein